MAVPEQTPFIEYTANGTTTVYPLTFDCDKSEYLIVSLDGEEAPVGSWSLTGGSITFNSAPANGVLITIERNTPFRRTTEYQSYNNSFRPSPVNKDFDLIWWKLQELGYRDQVIWLALLKEILDRELADEELKEYLLNQDALLKVDYIERDAQLKDYVDQMIALITGDPSFTGITTDFVFENGESQKLINKRTVKTVETIQDLIAISNPYDGQVVYVKGYYKPTNFALAQPYQGGGERTFVASRSSVNNEGTCINGWVLNNATEVTVNHFGVISGNGTVALSAQNKAQILKMIALDIRKFVFIDDEYFIDGGIDLSGKSNVQIVGSKLGRSSLIRILGTYDFGIKLGHFTSYNESLLIRDVQFFGTIANNTGSWQTDTYNIDKMLWLGGLVNDVKFQSVDIRYCTNAILSAGTNNWNRCYENVSIRYVKNGIITPEANANTFHKVYIHFFQEVAINAVGFGQSYTNCLLESNATNNPALIVSARGVAINGLYVEGTAEGVRFAGTTTNKSYGSVLQGSYITLRTVAGFDSKCVNIESGEGIVVAGNRLRNATYGIFGGPGTLNCEERKNNFFTVTNQVGGEGIDSAGSGLIVLRGNLRAEIRGLTRNGLENTLIRSSFTTTDNLMDVIVNSGSYQWRTYLGGRTGNDGGVRPLNTGADLGSSGSPWGNGYIQTAWNVTSDENFKQDISSLSPAELRVSQACAKLYVRYRLKDAVALKGDGARYHFGVIAQRVKEAFEAEGLDPLKYGVLCFGSWSDEEAIVNEDGQVEKDAVSGGERWAVRYDELNCFVNAGQQALIEQLLT